MAETKYAPAHGAAAHDESSVGTDHSYNNGNANGNGYSGSGGPMSRFITPGGHPVDASQPAFPVYHRKFGNPAPLGLISFGGTTFLLSLFNISTRGVAVPNVILGMALGWGGLAQVIVGIEEWACGNTFGATAFASYGGFWFAFGSLYIPQLAIADAYPTTAMFENAVGLFLITWGIVTFIFLLACLRSSIALVSLFFFLDLTFWLLAAGALTGSTATHKAGGAMGILTAAIAGYTALAGMLTKDTSHFLLPVGDLSRASK
ncbi:hypothetical protein IAU60_006194 [Kwoniella sp. DSM 27419]